MNFLANPIVPPYLGDEKMVWKVIYQGGNGPIKYECTCLWLYAKVLKENSPNSKVVSQIIHGGGDGGWGPTEKKVHFVFNALLLL